jgi:thioredoxin-like negative regulator of GroEL
MRLEELQEMIRTEKGVMLYFSGENCNVCHALRPKFKEAFDTHFPELKQIYLDAHENADISAHFQVFSVPTMIVFLDGNEFAREGRNVSLHQLVSQLKRPYSIMMG